MTGMGLNMGKMKKFLITVFHNSDNDNSKLYLSLKKLGYKRSFARENESHDLPENMFIRQAEGEDSEIIRQAEMIAITKLLEEDGVKHHALGVFVGDDWTTVVAIED